MSDNFNYDTFVRNPPNPVDTYIFSEHESLFTTLNSSHIPNSFNISSFNINGLRHNSQVKIEQISNFFNLKHISFGGIVDTHLSPKQIHFLSKRLPNYTVFSSDIDKTKQVKSTGGVSLFIEKIPCFSCTRFYAYYPIYFNRPSVASQRTYRLLHHLLSHGYEETIPVNASDSLGTFHCDDQVTRIDYVWSLTDQQWEFFSTHTDSLCDVPPSTFSTWHINQQCEYLHSRILKAANASLPSVIVEVIPSPPTLPCPLWPSSPKEKDFQDLSIRAKLDDRDNNFETDISSFIDSALSRTRRRITLDRVFIDHPTHPKLLTDPHDIDDAVIDHFQNSVPIKSSPPDTISTLPEKWSSAYHPMDDVDSSIYNSLLDPPTLEEWLSTVSSMPNDKAPDIPDLWRQAMVFPIPKPHEWKCQLKNTRPITLLEVIRKSLVKLFYNRLASILASNEVLKGGNFAGLPGGSCRDPIVVLESIIHDAHVNKSPLWILSQDISKAFDSVDLKMLRFALERIKLPASAIKFILSLFMKRSNRVFTVHGTTPSYRVRIGIDQGEVISPLLWVIYIDPLLTVLKNEMMDPYTLHAPSLINPLAQANSGGLRINNLVFMDDSTLISSSKSGMESMLSITEEFYQINNTSANHNKYVLITNLLPPTSVLSPSPVVFDLQLSGLNIVPSISIVPISMNSSFRFLGVWFNVAGSRDFVRKQVARESNSSSSFMKNLFLYRLRLIQFSFLIPISPLLVKDWTIWSKLFAFKQDYIACTIALLTTTPFMLLRSQLSTLPDLTMSNGTHMITWNVYLSNLSSRKGSNSLLLDRFSSDAIPSNINLVPAFGSSRKSMKWIVTLDDDGSPLFGKQLSKQQYSCKIVHWTSDCVTRPNDVITLTPCPGCSKHVPVTHTKSNPTDVTPLCIIPKLSPLRSLLLPTTQERIRHDTTTIASPFTWADLDETVRSYYGRLDIQPNFSQEDVVTLPSPSPLPLWVRLPLLLLLPHR
ncbi:RNA-directed DNA polymerase from mobile element jockey-like [Rhizophagus irregularis DAOM 181602=DAOM 197198]|nr:RNA-directed DNA polymerase from mobile element jockey-like [Rhizophagus irregularis DAOM 181602=DAOM 197198]